MINFPKKKKHLTRTRAAASLLVLPTALLTCLICRVVGSRFQHLDWCVALWEMTSDSFQKFLDCYNCIALWEGRQRGIESCQLHASISSYYYMYILLYIWPHQWRTRDLCASVFSACIPRRAPLVTSSVQHELDILELVWSWMSTRCQM